MPLSPDAQRAVAVRYQRLTSRTAETVRQRALTQWRQLGSYNEADYERLVRPSLELWEQAQAAAVRSTSAFNGVITDSGSIGLDSRLVAGTPPSVYGALRTVWKHLEEGMLWDEAVAIGGEVFAASHVTAYMQAGRFANSQWANAAGYRGAWQRILTGVSCEWCALVSTQLYHSAASAAFGHDNCDCVVAPATEGIEAMQKDMLATLYDETDIVNRLSASQASKRTLEAADNAERRSLTAMDKARAADSGGEDYERYVDRARTWERRAHELRVRAAEEATRHRQAPETSTGYVDPSGLPAPRP